MSIRSSQRSGKDLTTNNKDTDHLAKILVIGDGGVGKTSLITRFTDQRFITSYTATIGVDFKSRIIHHDDKSIKLQIWDTAGQQRFRNITQAYYRGSAGILLAYSITDQKSFNNIEKWIQQIEDNAPKDCCKIIVGTKLDCQQQRLVSTRQAQALATKMGVVYMQTSSKTGQGVSDAFLRLGHMVYETSLKKKVKTSQENLKLTNSRNQFAQKGCSC